MIMEMTEGEAGNSAEGCYLEQPNKRRGRPLGSKNRAKTPVTVEDFEGAVRPIVLTLQKGANIIYCLNQFSERNQIGISILTICGSVTNVEIKSTRLRGTFELKKLCGSFMPPIWSLPPSTLSATLESPAGQITGDIIGFGLWAAGPVTIVVTQLAKPVYYDIDSGDGIGSSSMHHLAPYSSSAAPSATQYTCHPNQKNGFPSGVIDSGNDIGRSGMHLPAPLSSSAAQYTYDPNQKIGFPSAVIDSSNDIGRSSMHHLAPLSSSAAPSATRYICHPNRKNRFPSDAIDSGNGIGRSGMHLAAPLSSSAVPSATRYACHQNQNNGFPSDVIESGKGVGRSGMHLPAPLSSSAAHSATQYTCHPNQKIGFPSGLIDSGNVHNEYPSSSASPHHPAGRNNECHSLASPGAIPDFSEYSIDSPDGSWLNTANDAQ